MANYNLREVLKQLGRNILSWVKSNCVNNCVSTTTNLPLAAAQGKVLQDQITTLNSNIESRVRGMFTTQTFAKNWSARNSYGSQITGTILNASSFAKKGYTPIGIIGAQTGSPSGYFVDCSLNDVYIAVAHVSGLPDKANISGTAHITVLYMKN